MNGTIRVFDSGPSVLLAEISAHARAITCLDTTLLPEKGSHIVSCG